MYKEKNRQTNIKIDRPVIAFNPIKLLKSILGPLTKFSQRLVMKSNKVIDRRTNRKKNTLKFFIFNIDS